ncbi:MAG: discoidin domain-containing protein, partial [Armatimonadetes bacterium]|nr:discoidin domain-containing protein [Armatimonadota bacterium]
MKIVAAPLILVLIALSTRSFATLEPADEFDYFTNNWNVVGLKDYRFGARVTPDNRILLGGKEGQADPKTARTVQVRFGRELTLLSRQQGKLARDGWMPIMEIAAADGPVHYEFSYWATPMPGVKDWRKAFDWPTEGENFLVWVHYKAANRSNKLAEAKIAIKLSGGAASGDRWVDKNLAPGETVAGAARYAYFAVNEEQSAALEKEDATLWLWRTIQYWRGFERSAAAIHVPCRKATDALKAAHVCQMIANDHGEVRGGEGFYDEFYIRDGAYQVMELEEAGLWDAARKSVELYLPRQRADGRFESQAMQFDANGQAVWVLWQYYQITGDRAWLERVYPAMVKAVEWTMKARREAPADSPFVGLLPAAVADGEMLWDGKHHIVGYDLWNLRGMLCTADAARALGKAEGEKKWRAEAQDYRSAIDAAVKRSGLSHFPPSWEKVGTHWGNTETLWPTELFGRDDARVNALINHVRREFSGGFVEDTIRWVGQMEPVIHPYMGAYTTMTDLVRGKDEQVVEDFYWYLLHSTAAHAFPEGVYYMRRFAWGDTIPHVTGAGNYAIMLRHMLVHEAGDELHLLSAVPDWWLAKGEEIRIERLPTHFGEMGLTVRGTAKGVEVDFSPPKRNPPKRIVLHLPTSRPWVNRMAGVEVVTRPNQKQKWDFPTVVSKYLRTAPPLSPPIFIESLTTGKPATCSLAFPGMEAARANDGIVDTDSYWGTDVNRDKAAWWQVDFEKPTAVGRVVVVGFFADKRSYGFTVEGSLDGKGWTTLADSRDNKAP